jgi:hypothetical protein
MSFKHQLENINRHLTELVGSDKSETILGDCLSLPKSAKPERIALAVNEAINRMDQSLDESARNNVMALSGLDCVNANKRAVEQALKRRNKYKTLDEYLKAEENNPSRGTRFKREGDTFYQWYTPSEWSKPMRCYCSLMKGLPDEVTSSKTYCQCSGSFVKKIWETVLNEPVEVKVLESAISGSGECRFEIKRAT